MVTDTVGPAKFTDAVGLSPIPQAFETETTPEGSGLLLVRSNRKTERKVLSAGRRQNAQEKGKKKAECTRFGRRTDESVEIDVADVVQDTGGAVEQGAPQREESELVD